MPILKKEASKKIQGTLSTRLYFPKCITTLQVAGLFRAKVPGKCSLSALPLSSWLCSFSFFLQDFGRTGVLLLLLLLLLLLSGREGREQSPCSRNRPASMAHAFLIHNVRCRLGQEAGLCRVLYSRVFSPERLDEGGCQDAEKERLRRKEQILAVARQAESACKLYHQASGKPPSEHLIQLPDEPVSLQDAASGVFRLPPGDPFCEEKTVLWLAVQSLGFALVCDPHENLMLAESTLRLLVKELLDHLKLLGSGSDVVLKGDKTEAILGKFLPHGQLRFLNDQFVLSLEREAAASLGK